MRFKQWLVKETGTSTGDIAGFSRITLPLIRRSWFPNSNKKKSRYTVPQVIESTEHKYSCVMFNFPKNHSKDILEWSKKNISEDVLFTDGEKGREDEIHVTVLYGLHSPCPVESTKIINKFDPAPIKLGEISKFESENYDVIKISVEGSILHKMNSALRKLPYSSNHPKYSPHCTLAYVKKGSCDNLLGKKYFESVSILMDSVVFSSFEGDKTTISLG